MNVKVFVLGRPGSGKSTASCQLKRHFARYGWSTAHINDYDILKEMFLHDTDHKQFRPTANNGFDAIDLSVLDLALHEVQQRVENSVSEAHLVTIEFARDDYRNAFKQFSPDFLRNAYVLFMNTDLETCLHRVHERVKHARSSDDHPSFSDEIFRSYYRNDNRCYMQNELKKEFKLKSATRVIDNTGSLERCIGQVHQFADAILERELSHPIAV